MEARTLQTPFAWLVALLVACGGAASKPEPEPEPEPRGGPPAVEPSQQPRFSGVVEEVLRGGPYSYLRIANDSGEHWVVTMSSPPALSERVEVESFGMQRDFHARRIDRSFDVLEFGTVVHENPKL